MRGCTTVRNRLGKTREVVGVGKFPGIFWDEFLEGDREELDKDGNEERGSWTLVMMRTSPWGTGLG